MLVISRRIGESFMIGDNIEATIVDITGEKVILGVNAPKDVTISRREVADTRKANIDAAAPSKSKHMDEFPKLYKETRPETEK